MKCVCVCASETDAGEGGRERVADECDLLPFDRTHREHCGRRALGPILYLHILLTCDWTCNSGHLNGVYIKKSMFG